MSDERMKNTGVLIDEQDLITEGFVSLVSVLASSSEDPSLTLGVGTVNS
jgi:hypothetical protein